MSVFIAAFCDLEAPNLDLPSLRNFGLSSVLVVRECIFLPNDACQESFQRWSVLFLPETLHLEACRGRLRGLLEEVRFAVCLSSGNQEKNSWLMKKERAQ